MWPTYQITAVGVNAWTEALGFATGLPRTPGVTQQCLSGGCWLPPSVPHTPTHLCGQGDRTLHEEWPCPPCAGQPASLLGWPTLPQTLPLPRAHHPGSSRHQQPVSGMGAGLCLRVCVSVQSLQH